MIADDEVIEVESTPADPVDVFYVEWAQDTAKRNLHFLNETMARLVTLNATLLGGSLVFLKDDVVSPLWKMWAIVFFLASLMAAIFGMIPWPGVGPVNLFEPAAIRAHKAQAQRFKENRLRYSLLYLIGGLFVAVLGYATGLIWPAAHSVR
jgi:hypothetical protein